MFHLTKNDKISRSLCGLSLPLKTIKIYPVKMRQVLEVGETQYSIFLALLINPKKLIESLEVEVNEVEQRKLEVSDYDLLAAIIQTQPGLKQQVIKALNFFLPEYEIKYNDSHRLLEIVQEEENILLDNEVYNELIDILKLQNFVKEQKQEEEEDEGQPANAKAAQLLARRKKLKQDLKQAKEKTTEPLTFADYISIVMGKGHILDANIILNMTVYSFFDYIERIILIENYHVGIQQLLGGADPAQVELKHWLCSLKEPKGD